jgi:uncharacterized protein (TIGR02145 family)
LQEYDAVNNVLYHVVELAGRCWFKQNLRGIKYSDGAEIPFANPYYHLQYPNTAQNALDFGLLYTYASVAGGDACPNGWRLPTAAEWGSLSVIDAAELKNANFWLQPNPNTNGSGFDSHGAGIYNGETGKFEKLYGYTAYWSSNPGTNSCTCAELSYYCSRIEMVEILKENAISVRCIKK